MVSCIIMQKKRGTTLATETVAFWDQNMDGFAEHSWEGKGYICIVHVFAAAI